MSSHSSSDIVVDVYEVPEAALTDLKDQMSSTRLAHSDSLKSKSTVHIQFIGRPKGSVFEVFFNNELQYSTRSSTTTFTVKNHVYKFSWAEPGKFFIKSPDEDPPRDKLVLEIGKEYFFVAGQTIAKEVFIYELTKDQFENEMYRRDKVLNVSPK
jgi:hypothetical protein